MRKELKSGVAVVSLISPSYFENSWCVAELGATWALVKAFYPILVPPITYSSLPSFLAGTQSLLLDNDSHLDRLSDGLPKLLGTKFNIAKWNTKKKQFLAELPKILRKLKKPVRLTPEEAEKLQKTVTDYETLVTEQTAEIADLNAKLSALAKLKNQRDVAKVLKPSKQTDQFEQIVKKAKAEISPLARATTEALFQWFRGSDFVPGDDWPREDIEPAAESGEISQHDPDRPVFTINENKPRVRKAVAALNDLRSFQKRSSEKFAEWFEQEYDDEFDVESRDFWNEFLW